MSYDLPYTILPYVYGYNYEKLVQELAQKPVLIETFMCFATNLGQSQNSDKLQLAMLHCQSERSTRFQLGSLPESDRLKDG